MKNKKNKPQKIRLGKDFNILIHRNAGPMKDKRDKRNKPKKDLWRDSEWDY